MFPSFIPSYFPLFLCETPILNTQQQYQYCLSDVTKFNGEIFNVGTENLKIIEVAEKVKNIVENFKLRQNIEIRVEESADIRSYMINSDKIKRMLNFTFKKTVDNAIEDLCKAFENKTIVDSFSDQWSNIKVLTKKEENKNLSK